ncbi:MAG: ABC transporter transmembrane domain-containing protein [Pseudomonadota bacterium]
MDSQHRPSQLTTAAQKLKPVVARAKVETAKLWQQSQAVLSAASNGIRSGDSATPRNLKTAIEPVRPLLQLAPYLLRYRFALIGAAVALVVSAAATLAVPIAVRRVIDFGFSAERADLINQYFSVLILIGLVLAIASSARFYFVNWLGERVVSDLRADVFQHLTRLGASFFAQTHSGEVMSRLTADTTQIKTVAGSTLSQALRNAIMLIGALIMMFFTSTELSALILGAIPAIVLPLMIYGRMVRKLSRRAQDELADASAYASENLGAVRTMQAFVNEAAVSARYSGAIERAFDAARNKLLARSGLTALAIFLVTASVVGILWYGAASVISGDMTAGTLGQFVLYAVFAAGALAELAEVWGEVAQAAGASERLIELLAVAPEITDPAHPMVLPHPIRGAVTFDKVSFAHRGRDNTPAIIDFDLAIEPGENVALVGPSGSGKSTLLNLLLRFYDPQRGHVLLDGMNVSTIALSDLRSNIALVPQEVAMFADTVVDNIRYGSPQASLADVKKAALLAQADGFIEDLPDGYNTRLGERGITLSGGQRQRLALARAMVKDASVLLLDEATSALDAESERQVQSALEMITAKRTTIVIAHRLATIQKADRIVVMDQGRIVDQGRHPELMSRDGLYRRLASLQFGAEAAE